MFRDEFDPGGVVERMKIIIIDFFFFSLSLTFAVWKEKTGQESKRERERERRKEGKRKLPYVYRYPYISPVITYLPGTLGYSGYFTLLRFASLYFFFLANAAKNYIGTYIRYIHGLTCTYLYLSLPCVLYI